MLESDIVKIIKNFINKNPLGVIGTIGSDGVLWGAAVYFGCDERNPILYFSTKNQTRKHHNMQKSPQISVVFVDEANQATIQASGETALVSNNQEANAAAEAFNTIVRKTDDWKLPLSKLNAGNYELYKVNLQYIRLTGFGRHSNNAAEKPEIIEHQVSR